jgi:hypothetical protein
MPIVFAAPATTPSTPGVGLPRRMTWTGFDGSVWPLTRPQATNPLLRPGVQGLHMPRMDVFKSSSPLVAGVELEGYSLPEREVYWPLLFRNANTTEWAQQHGEFFDSFHPVQTGVWTAGTGADERTLPLTGVFDGSYSFDRDPFVTGRAIIGLQLEAPRPLWRGRPVAKEFSSDEGQEFIPITGAPDFYVSPSATFQQATIDNPGDEPAYLRWTGYGPLTDVQLGVGGALIDVPFPIPDGSELTIDTDPTGQYARLDGVDVTRDLGFQMFAPVPARGTSPLVIVAGGPGRVRAELVPLYWRAF